MTDSGRDWLLWGSELSPFALKLALCCRYAGLPHRFLPEQGSWAENWRCVLRVERLKRGGLPITWPLMILPRNTQTDAFYWFLMAWQWQPFIAGQTTLICARFIRTFQTMPLRLSFNGRPLNNMLQITTAYS